MTVALNGNIVYTININFFAYLNIAHQLNRSTGLQIFNNLLNKLRTIIYLNRKSFQHHIFSADARIPSIAVFGR